MDHETIHLLTYFGYKMACIVIGGISISLGYKLFMNGIWGNAGDLDVKFEKSNVVLRSAAPGSFFAVLGAAVLIFTIINGYHFKLTSNSDIYENFTSTDPPPPLIRLSESDSSSTTGTESRYGN